MDCETSSVVRGGAQIASAIASPQGYRLDAARSRHHRTVLRFGRPDADASRDHLKAFSE